MSNITFQPNAVYTIIPRKNIEAAYKNNGTGKLIENKAWVTAKSDFESLKNGEGMALLLADASNIKGVEWIAQIDGIKLNKVKGTTTVLFSKITKLPTIFKLSRIKLRNGATLSNSHIRPYALAIAPKSLLPLLENWKPQSPKKVIQKSNPSEPSYWVIKGNPRQNNWSEMLIPGNKSTWHSARAPKHWAVGDRIFCWESTPSLRMVGLAEITNTNKGRDKHGDLLFEIKYLTTPFDYQPTMAELRSADELKGCSFLKVGPATTVFPIKKMEAEVIYQLIFDKSEAKQDIWPDLLGKSVAQFPDVDEAAIGVEGQKKLVQHLRRERNLAIIKKKKDQVIKLKGKITCEVCGFDFGKVYGKLGANYCEVHHLIPLSEGKEARETSLNDLITICSNCHRMIHKLPSKDSLKVLMNIIKGVPS